ncbi:MULTISPECIES: porin family protein [Chryseobacterium]|uniref:porin family protein n=1 Tax=Chryseobacterium TaxID=59732 RepID=UPI001551F514|nr:MULTISPECIES: porin family protein [unclassified Chryseobacterium]MDC8103863.1 PorT family protein [Chryseobacterium sp. B21-037]MDQ1803471.1 porin family protein [Chryseobacterium sp. CKR4-1]WBV57398.1 porin family protein [Chryseobacterium daecheongense]
MNKLFLGLAIVAGSLVFAQETQTTATITTVNKEKEPIRFGIKGGANSAQFSQQQLSANNQKIGFNAGVFVNIPLSKQFSIQPEALYNQLGARSVLSSTEVTTGATTVKTQRDYKTTLNYVSVPVMVQFKPADNFYVEAGPEFSYFIDGKNKGENTVTSTTNGIATTQKNSVSETINKDDINKFNFGLGLGLGYYFTRNLGINARYVNSLTKIDKSRPAAENNNRVFQLGLNYKF